MNNNEKMETESQIVELIHQLRANLTPNVETVQQLLKKLNLFHIYELERSLKHPDPRLREAALKKVETLLPLLQSSNLAKREEGILALEHLFEHVKMLNEDA